MEAQPPPRPSCAGLAICRAVVILLADDTLITIIATHTGEITATNRVQREVTFWRDTTRVP